MNGSFLLDTNIIISGLGFGGKPREILDLILDDKIKAVTSPILLAELEDVITKKFQKLTYSIEPINKQISKINSINLSITELENMGPKKAQPRNPSVVPTDSTPL